MELDSSLQYSSGQLQAQKFDAFIAVSGYESRSAHLASQINLAGIPHKIVLAFQEKKDLLYRELNDLKYKEQSFEFIEISSGDASDCNDILDDLCEKIGKPELNILIDYSSMPKVWYSEIISYFNNKEDGLICANLWFAYTPSEFIKSIGSISNKYLDPVKPNNLGEKPVALILGLGYEKGRAEDFARLCKSDVTYAFYANPAVDSRYVQEVLDNNKTVLKDINRNQIISYPIHNLNSINETLTQLCIGLRMSHQILLVPVGPKPFTLMCFVLSARYPDIAICRVSSVIKTVASDHRAQGDVLVYKLTFTNEEVDY